MNANLNHLILDLYNEAQAETASAFGTSALAKLKGVIPFDSAGNTTFSFGEDGRAFITGFASLNVAPNKGELRLQFIGPESFNKKTGLSSRDALLKTSVANPDRSHRMSVPDLKDENVIEYAKRSGSIHCLCFVNKNDHRNAISTLSFWREERSGAFSDEQLFHSNLLMPHVVQALAINRKIVSSVLVGNKDQQGVIVAEAGGTIHYIDDLAIILLRREFPQWLSHVLPKEVIAGFRSNSVGRYVGKQITINVRRQNAVMAISIQARGEGGSLTPAELRVVEKIVQYGNYKEVARQLDVSVSTVRNQLHAIYKKLGIQGKSELIKSFSHLD